MITDQQIEVMADRWPAVIVRFLPFLLIKIGAPLKFTMIAFSVSYIIFQFIIFYLILHVFKSPRLALLQLLVLLLGCSQGFYWCNSELIQGMSVLILFKAYWDAHGTQWNSRHGLGFLFLGLVLLYIHPLVIFPLLFIFLYDAWRKTSIEKTSLLIGIGFSLLWVVKRWLDPNWYDRMKSGVFLKNLKKYELDIWSTPAVDHFISAIWSNYHFVVLGLFMCIVILLFQKKYLLLAFTLIYVLAYTSIVFISDPQISNKFYSEINFYPLVLIFFFVILHEIDSIRFSAKAIQLTISILIIVSLIRIGISHKTYTMHLAWINAQLDNSVCNKVMVDNEDIPDDIRLDNWSLPYESLIQSHFAQSNKSMHPIINRFNKDNNYIDSIFVTQFKLLEEGDFVNDYFVWPEGPYCRLE